MMEREVPGVVHYFKLLEENIDHAHERLQRLKESIGDSREDRLSIAQELASDSYRIVGISAVLGRLSLEDDIKEYNTKARKLMSGEL